MISINKDILDREEKVEEESKVKEKFKQKDRRVFTFLPTQDGKVYVNKLYVALFRPANFSLFKSVYPADYWDYKLAVKVHYINAETDEGEITTHMVLCGPSMNEWNAKVLGLSPYFSKDCIMCAESQKYWNLYNERRKQLGLFGEDAKKLTAEQYKAAIAKDEELVKYKGLATSYSVKDRYILEVIDWEKVTGQKKLAEGEYVEFQVAFAPDVVNKKLRFKVKEVGVEFWNLDDPKIVLVSRDTTVSVRASKYDVDIWNGKPEFSKELKEYISDERNLVDVSEFIEVWDSKTAYEKTGLSNVSEVSLKEKENVNLSLQKESQKIEVKKPEPSTGVGVKLPPKNVSEPVVEKGDSDVNKKVTVSRRTIKW